MGGAHGTKRVSTGCPGVGASDAPLGSLEFALGTVLVEFSMLHKLMRVAYTTLEAGRYAGLASESTRQGEEKISHVPFTLRCSV